MNIAVMCHAQPSGVWWKEDWRSHYRSRNT